MLIYKFSRLQAFLHKRNYLFLNLHQIVDSGIAFPRRFQANNGSNTGGGFRWGAITPATVVDGGSAFSARRFAHLGEFLGAGVAMIGVALIN